MHGSPDQWKSQGAPPAVLLSSLVVFSIDVFWQVYDVSSYVDEHPGGLAILKNAGGDATEGFHGPQHPPRVFDIIDDFLIGHLVD